MLLTSFSFYSEDLFSYTNLSLILLIWSDTKNLLFLFCVSWSSFFCCSSKMRLDRLCTLSLSSMIAASSWALNALIFPTSSRFACARNDKEELRWSILSIVLLRWLCCDADYCDFKLGELFALGTLLLSWCNNWLFVIPIMAKFVYEAYYDCSYCCCCCCGCVF